jgi:hypothetical protein
MSIFASYVTRTVAIPFDEPHTVTIQKLTAKSLAAARQATVAASMELVKAIGGQAIGRELADLGSAAVADQVEQVQADPLRRYDRSTVLAKGITSWTYSEPLTPERLDDLTDEAADFLARAILTLTLPNGDAEKKSST